ncbi:hypothetical protein A3F45_01230 [Candidatus Curtissbacteria bacterium RIFCSPHIGHO2_12_FULL_41_17]|uniref:Transposase IS200-like domain-containing protein n=2 Tax=Candidatus Curtissiibacteriota TaxID=1752717 RepID=A0A1F5HKP9_9BACT|nr:MAG: hypothetical protein A2693_00805 [Candidatus Curtissbacteria bacterium RIFCSPHIGHO2_01_FULL_40_12]OGE04717.1 MAG: hypothetical protein A3F45_01230 [Candidatus Curtissbacteria bacterium RIFCSPHIGHO2_12_FULL_41_17]
MPGKNVLKQYVEEGYYHIYNRGVEKRKIFLDEQDYKVFLKYLKLYLDPPGKLPIRKVSIGNNTFQTVPRPLKNYYDKVKLLSYCLMPNHFHLLIKQTDKKSIELFMRSLATKYSVYFNKKYNRVGSLFQGPYKAVLASDDIYLLHLSRYIHLNPGKDSPYRMAYSSYPEYLQKRNTSWIYTKDILSHFKTAKKTSLKDMLSYQSFVDDYFQDPKEMVGELAID